MVWEITVENNFKGSGKKVKANGRVIEIGSAPETFSLQPGETLTIFAVFDNPEPADPTYMLRYTDWVPDNCFEDHNVPYEGPYRQNGETKFIIEKPQETGTPDWRVIIQCTAELVNGANGDDKSGNVTVGDDQ
jgi:hypothetical protein